MSFGVELGRLHQIRILADTRRDTRIRTRQVFLLNFVFIKT